MYSFIAYMNHWSFKDEHGINLHRTTDFGFFCYHEKPKPLRTGCNIFTFFVLFYNCQ